MIIGIIYKYTSPSGKVYIGQTTNERHRRNTWFCQKYRYAGVAINRARAKYGPENFTYEVLFKKKYNNKEEAIRELNNLEIYYIRLFDSYKNGYNNTIGGNTSIGHVVSHETRIKLSKINKGIKRSKESIEKARLSLLGSKHSKEAVKHSKLLRRNSGRLSKVGQYDEQGHLIIVWSCVAEAAESIGVRSTNIYRAVNTLGKYKGFYWRKAPFSKQIKLSKHNKNSKKVEQYSLDNKYIRTFNSLIEAANFLGKNYSNISTCCRGKIKSAYGYIWKFEN